VGLGDWVVGLVGASLGVAGSYLLTKEVYKAVSEGVKEEDKNKIYLALSLGKMGVGIASLLYGLKGSVPSGLAGDFIKGGLMGFGVSEVAYGAVANSAVSMTEIMEKAFQSALR